MVAETIRRVLETCVYAADLDAAERFYAGVLGLELFARAPGRHVFFRCGPAMFLVFDAARTASPEAGVPSHGASGPGHVCFAVADAAIDAWRSQLEAAGIAIEFETSWPRGGRSLYVRDPAGNSVEIASPRIWGLPE
ncbi:MAG: VOC family protein [Gemmatimonadetes bacterium]|nr:VOC family protein [Gemmatimonadota bacterium]